MQKKRLLEKIMIQLLTAAGKPKLREPVKILLMLGNKMIQRTLGVKVDGIMGTKSMAALEAMTNTD
jgi:hypothetical protein